RSPGVAAAGHSGHRHARAPTSGCLREGWDQPQRATAARALPHSDAGMIALLANPAQIGHASEGHPERPERVAAILEAIARSDLGLVPEPAPDAPEALVHRVHDPSYVTMLDRAATSGGGFLDPDTYITPLSMVAARSAAGAVVEGVQRVLDGKVNHALAVVRPPGHHAEHAKAMGFCLLNNIAVGLVAARDRGIRRIAVLDFDVHHGNGTQHSF